MNFICDPCKNASDTPCLTPETRQAMHQACKGGTWCDCQHQTDRRKAK